MGSELSKSARAVAFTKRVFEVTRRTVWPATVKAAAWVDAMAASRVKGTAIRRSLLVSVGVLALVILIFVFNRSGNDATAQSKSQPGEAGGTSPSSSVNPVAGWWGEHTRHGSGWTFWKFQADGIVYAQITELAALDDGQQAMIIRGRFRIIDESCRYQITHVRWVYKGGTSSKWQPLEAKELYLSFRGSPALVMWADEPEGKRVMERLDAKMSKDLDAAGPFDP